MTCVMFAGMALCLPLALFQERTARRNARKASRGDGASAGDASIPLLEAGEGRWSPAAEAHRAALLAVPTAFDLVATVLMNVGLLSVTV